jgi:hypothetical protein
MISLESCKDVVILLSKAHELGGLFTLGARYTSHFGSSAKIIQTSKPTWSFKLKSRNQEIPRRILPAIPAVQVSDLLI